MLWGGGGGARCFQVSVIVRGAKGTGGPDISSSAIFGHAHFWVSRCKSLSHAEPCPLTPTLPQTGGWDPCLTPRS